RAGGRPGLSRVDQPVDPHVIDLQGRGEGAVVHAFLAAPVATDGDVQQEVEVLVERPGFRAVAFVDELIDLLVVDVAADRVGRPVHAIAVELRRRVVDDPGGGLLRTDAVVVCAGMHGDVDAPGVVPDVLHDVYLAGCGPTAVGLVGGQHPDRGP